MDLQTMVDDNEDGEVERDAIRRLSRCLSELESIVNGRRIPGMTVYMRAPGRIARELTRGVGFTVFREKQYR